MTLPFDLDAYLQRIGHDGPRTPSLETLSALHLAHVGSIAFENLDPWLRRPVPLDLVSLQHKLVASGRGGYCYEHNLLLGAALRCLGFGVVNLSARVHWNIPPDITRPRTHMLLAVDVAAQRYIVDAGFGGLTLTAPLRLDRRAPQRTPHGAMRLSRRDGLYVMEAEVSGHQQRNGNAGEAAWHALYSFDLQAQLPADYELANWYQCHHPASVFRTLLMAARPLADGRLVLRDHQLSFYPRQGPVSLSRIGSVGELRETLTQRFGLRLDALEGLDERLASVIAASLTS